MVFDLEVVVINFDLMLVGDGLGVCFDVGVDVDFVVDVGVGDVVDGGISV